MPFFGLKTQDKGGLQKPGLVGSWHLCGALNPRLSCSIIGSPCPAKHLPNIPNQIAETRLKDGRSDGFGCLVSSAALLEVI